MNRVLVQHLDDAISLRSLRSVLVRQPHVTLRDLSRSDERLKAHLDGLVQAGRSAKDIVLHSLGRTAAGELFVAAVLAIEQRDQVLLQQLLSLLAPLSGAERALASAIAWVEIDRLGDLTERLLTAREPEVRWLGLAACRLHRIDVGEVLTRLLVDTDAKVRQQAFRTACATGRIDILPACQEQMNQGDPNLSFCAAQAAVLLGDRDKGLAKLRQFSLQPGPHQLEALRLGLFADEPEATRFTIGQLQMARADPRVVIQASAWSGDPERVPWLIGQIKTDTLARVAGEAFCFITGADLETERLHREAPEDGDAGPNDDPTDSNVEMDADENLRWPDVAKVEAWWHAQRDRYGAGVRHLAGHPPTDDHCVRVLKASAQRLRHAAAMHRCLLGAGRSLFNCSAPAARQGSQLAAMASQA